MAIKKSLTSIVLVGALALDGCGGTADNNNTDQQYQTIKGVPIGVGESYASFGGCLTTVIDIDGKKLLGYTPYGSTTKKNAEAMALIQSEILDGDNELIELTGKYIGNRFEIRSIKANEYQVNF